jgi:hypothetical protein
MISIPPASLTTEELIRYTQMYIDKKEPAPPDWIQELIKRMIASEDSLYRA